MWIWILLFRVVTSAPADEFHGLVREGELEVNDEKHVMNIVPSGYSPQRVEKHEEINLTDYVEDSINYESFVKLLSNGYAKKGLTFNLYDDNMREATIEFFRILQKVNPENIEKVEKWAKHNINMDIFDYALRLASTINGTYHEKLVPPFVYKPNYFVNSETIVKGLMLQLNHGRINDEEAKINQIKISKDFGTFTINTNYSGWNFPGDSYEETVNYFREDIGLNSYYYGIHLLHPFWMSNEELDVIFPRHAEHYQYLHRQLLARYFLEQEHLKQTNKTKECVSDYSPYLIYENGLSFPYRPCFMKDGDNTKASVLFIDIAMKEFISRGLLMMENGTFVRMTEDNYLQLLPKLLKGNLDRVKPAQIIRTLFGYGGGPVQHLYTPAPSVIHHPQTSLRDRVYWHLIERAVNYSLDFIKTLKPYDLTQYDTDEYSIIEGKLDDITTYFDYYEFPINKKFYTDVHGYNSLPTRSILARQRRLTHLPFTLNFVVHSNIETKVVMRLFLGPSCTKMTCWSLFDKFFELDSYTTSIEKGNNLISWTTENSARYSSDYHYDMKQHEGREKYNMFKFPQRLAMPRGLEQGLNLTVFISITTYEEYDEKPYGFPFHRPAADFHGNYNNHRFYDITIFHKKGSADDSGYFSPHLY